MKIKIPAMKNCLEMVSRKSCWNLKLVLLDVNLAVNFDVTPNYYYLYVCGPCRVLLLVSETSQENTHNHKTTIKQISGLYVNLKPTQSKTTL